MAGALSLDDLYLAQADVEASVRWSVASTRFDIGGEITNDEIVFDLPYIGNVSIPLPIQR